jgi:hypothetical protein
VVLSPAAPLAFVAPPQPVPVTLEFRLGRPDWLAFHDGDGAWELVQPITPTVTRDVLDPMGRYAWLCGSASGTDREVDYYPSTAAEEPVMRLSIPSASAATITVTGTVTGLAAGETARPFFNDSTLFAGTSATSSSGFSFVASPGTADLIFLIKDATGAPARMVRFNAINLSASLAMTPIDLTPAAAVGTIPVFAAGVAADANVAVSTRLRTGNGTFFTVGSRSTTGLAVPLGLPSLPDTAWST